MSIMLLRLAVVSCGVAALVTGVLAIEFRERARELEAQLVATGSLVAESRFEADHANALRLQYERRPDSLSCE